MHPYATDSHERRHVIYGMTLLSTAVAYVFHQVMALFKLELPWFVDAPSVMGIFGLLYMAFERWLWRAKVWRRIGIVRVADLNGEWDVEGQTSFDGSRYQAKAVIKQTWTSMSIFLERELSESRSLTASLLVNQPEGPTLNYEYRNDPKTSAPPTMHSHRGTATLRLKNDSILEGEYYSGRDRQNYGSLILRRVAGAR